MFTTKEYKEDKARKADKPYFYDLRGTLHVSEEAARNTPKTHEIRFYGGNREKVAILRNYTRTLGDGTFSLYGAMQVISDEPDILGNHTRWVHFGLYNANFAFALQTNIMDDSDEPYARALMVMSPRNLRNNYRFYANKEETETIRLIRAIALERRIDVESDEENERDFTYIRDM